MARQIGYGALTITDVTDGINNATVYLYQRFASVTGHTPPANNKLTYNFTTGKLTGATADFNGWSQTIPNGNDPLYVVTAVAASVENTYIIPAWSDETRLVVNGEDGTDGIDGTSITAVKEVYYFTTGTAPAQSTLVNGTPITSESTAANQWSTAVPAYIAGGHYYTSLQTSMSKGTSPMFSAISLNQALTDANNNAAIAKSIAQANEENAQGALAISQGLESKLRYIWVNLNEPSTLPTDDTKIDDTYYLGGTYAASGVDGVTFDTSKASTYGWNSLLRHTKLMFRYNGIALTTLGIDGLKLFSPIVSNSKVTDHQLGIELTATKLNIYNPASQKVSMMLDSGGLTLYKYNSTTAAATLNTTGLNIAAGGIKGGSTSDLNKFVYVSTEDFGSSFTVNGHAATDWRLLVNNKFGVDKAGNLYASNATIEGAIEATSGSIADTVTIGGTTASTLLADVSAGENFLKNAKAARTFSITTENENYSTWYEETTTAKTITNGNTTDTFFVSYDWSTTQTVGYVYPQIYSTSTWIISNIQFASGTDSGSKPGNTFSSTNKSGHSEIVFKLHSTQAGTAEQKLRFRCNGCTTTGGSVTISNVVFTRGGAANAGAKFLTYISATDGVKIHSANETTNYLQIKSGGVYIYKGGVEQAYFTGTAAAIGTTGKGRVIIKDDGLHVYDYVSSTQRDIAYFGNTARVGLSTGSHFMMNAASLQAFNASGTKYFEVSASGITFGSNTAATKAAVDTAQTTANNAAKTATNFLSYDSTNGLKIAQSSPSSATTNYVQITSSAVNVIKDSTHKAVVNSSGMSVYSGSSSVPVAVFGSIISLLKTSSTDDGKLKISSNSMNSAHTYTATWQKTATGSNYCSTGIQFPAEGKDNYGKAIYVGCWVKPADMDSSGIADNCHFYVENGGRMKSGPHILRSKVYNYVTLWVDVYTNGTETANATTGSSWDNRDVNLFNAIRQMGWFGSVRAVGI